MPFSTGNGGQDFLTYLTPSVLNFRFVYIAIMKSHLGHFVNNSCHTRYMDSSACPSENKSFSIEILYV